MAALRRTDDRSVAAERIAVVLFNLGGPDSPAAIRPFIFNLFNDPAIIGAPQPLRWCLATLIAGRRVGEAREIFAQIGGRSPLLDGTRKQASALEAALVDVGEVRAFVAMRYWHPMSDEAAVEVKAFDPDQVVLVPLYPQFSTTTTASSLARWHRAAAAAGLNAPTRAVCCYPTDAGLVAAHATLLRRALHDAGDAGSPRLLFSAHGLPKRVLARGDPYVWQVERTAEAVAAVLAPDFPELDWRICYQSRVGPLEWVGPSTDDELARAGGRRLPVVVAPIAFVSEHSETLVELDIKCRGLAEKWGVPRYIRVPTLGVGEAFVAALAAIVRRVLQGTPRVCSAAGGRLCPPEFTRCALPPEAED